MDDQHQLYSVSYHPKRSGGTREVHAPHWPLRNIQRKLLLLLEELYRPSSRVMGFVKGRGIRKNATFHVGKRLILNIDLQDYFGSIHVGRIRRRLMARPYELTDDVATTVAKLCTLNDRLPTGAPTSPIIANIISSSLDGALAFYAKQHGCFYTRYADDITFSTNRRSLPPGMVQRSEDAISGIAVGSDLLHIVTEQGFAIQPTKTRLMDDRMRNEVCGVTCNERLNVRRTFMREIRGALHAWRKHGRQAAEEEWHARFNWREAISLERSLRGRIEYVAHIRGVQDAATANLVSQFNMLPDRQFKNIDYSFSATDPFGILNSVCLIDCGDDHLVEYSQGTGFVIDGGAVVTNHHVVSRRPVGSDRRIPAQTFPNIMLRFENHSISYPMKLVHSDEEKDVAILRCDNPDWNPFFAARSCRLNFKDSSVGASVQVVGYPNHTEGASCQVYPGHVTGHRILDGQRYFSVSQPIVKGNSGGPVIDEFGQVVGIATRGVDAADVANLAFNGCIPLHSVDRILLAEY